MGVYGVYKVWRVDQDATAAVRVAVGGYLHAAEEWAVQHDERAADYLIADGRPVSVWVESEDTGDRKRLTVSGHVEARYEARLETNSPESQSDREENEAKAGSGIRWFPEPLDRVESGVVRFGSDWTGTFVRGDQAGHYAMRLRSVLMNEASDLDRRALHGLYDLLRSSVQGPARTMLADIDPAKSKTASTGRTSDEGTTTDNTRRICVWPDGGWCEEGDLEVYTNGNVARRSDWDYVLATIPDEVTYEATEELAAHIANGSSVAEALDAIKKDTHEAPTILG